MCVHVCLISNFQIQSITFYLKKKNQKVILQGCLSIPFLHCRKKSHSSLTAILICYTVINSWNCNQHLFFESLLLIRGSRFTYSKEDQKDFHQNCEVYVSSLHVYQYMYFINKIWKLHTFCRKYWKSVRLLQDTQS